MDCLTYVLNFSKCEKIFLKDGITSNEFEVKRIGKLFQNLKFKTSLKTKEYNNINKTLSILKNLDEYQLLICKEIPNISDNNPIKKYFQKNRIYIFIVIHKILSMIEEHNYDYIDNYNKLTNLLLVLTSDLFQSFKLEKKYNNYDKLNSFYKDIAEQMKINDKIINLKLDEYY